LKKLFRALIDTLKDPHLLSSEPHTGEEHHQEWDDDTQAIYEDNESLQEPEYDPYWKERLKPIDDTGWTCSQCQIRHTSDMEIGHREWDFLSEEILLCVQCCDDLNHQGASEAEKDAPHPDATTFKEYIEKATSCVELVHLAFEWKTLPDHLRIEEDDHDNKDI